MSLKDAQFNLRSSLLGTGLVQPVSTGMEKGKVVQVWALCRQIPHQEKPWLKVVADLLQYAEQWDIDLHICRRYIRKNGVMVYGWHLGVSGSSRRVAASLQGISTVLEQARPDLEPAPMESAPRGRGALPGVVPFAGPADLGPAPLDAPAAPAPRPPAPPANVPDPPRGFQPAIKVVHSSVDEETGRPFVVEEMPLPHVYQEMNRPTPKGKGAKYLGGGGTR